MKIDGKYLKIAVIYVVGGYFNAKTDKKYVIVAENNIKIANINVVIPYFKIFFTISNLFRGILMIKWQYF